MEDDIIMPMPSPSLMTYTLGKKKNLGEKKGMVIITNPRNIVKNYRASGMFRVTRNAMNAITSRIPDKIEHSTKNPYYAYTLVDTLNAFRRSYALPRIEKKSSLAGTVPLIRILVNLSLSERMHQIVEIMQRRGGRTTYGLKDDADTVLVHTREIVRQKFPGMSNLRYLNAKVQRELRPGTPLFWALLSQIIVPYFINSQKKLQTIRMLQDAAVAASMLKVYERLPRQSRIAAAMSIHPELVRRYSQERQILMLLFDTLVRRTPR